MSESDPRLVDMTTAKKLAEYAFRLEAVVKAYYKAHMASHPGATECDLCKQAELAWASVARAVSPGQTGHLVAG